MIRRIGNKPLVSWLAHKLPTTYLVVAFFYAGLDIVDIRFHNGWQWFALTFPVLCVLIFAHIVHSISLCTICAKMTPLDGQATAEGKQRSLKSFHTGVYFKLALVFFVIVPLLLMPFREDEPHLLSYLSIDLGYLLLALSLRADYLHRILEPWCPFCRWDDGGDHECEHSPVTPETGAKL